VEVEVDVETGAVSVEKVYSVHDVGRAINPDQVVGQVEGGVVQALGYAVTENFLQDGGEVQTDRFSTYLIPTVLDVPKELVTIIMEEADPEGPCMACNRDSMYAATVRAWSCGSRISRPTEEQS
jgi:CO/xanthine dehydrogenase Mo-binding subunit